MPLPPKDSRVFRIGDQGQLSVPRDVLEQAGLEPKMLVRFRLDGKTIVVERAAPVENPLEGRLGRRPDRDLFDKIQVEQEKERERLREKFEKGIGDAAKDETPPDHPFRRD